MAASTTRFMFRTSMKQGPRFYQIRNRRPKTSLPEHLASSPRKHREQYHTRSKSFPAGDRDKTAPALSYQGPTNLIERRRHHRAARIPRPPAPIAPTSEQQHFGLLDLRQGLHLGEHIGRHRAVDLDQSDRVTARGAATEMKGRNVDFGIAEQAREMADEAWLVLVRHIDHRPAEFGIDADALDVDESRLAVGVDRTRHRALLPLGGDGDRDQAFVVAVGCA